MVIGDRFTALQSDKGLVGNGSGPPTAKKKKKKKKNRGTLAHFKSGASDKSETSSGPTKQTFIAQDLSNVNLNGNT